MKKEEQYLIDNHLDNFILNPKCKDYEQRVYASDAMRDYSKKQLYEIEEKLKRAYIKLIKHHVDSGYCYYCGEYLEIGHEVGCLIPEAQTWLEDKE